jgi:hypothetical protein
MEFTSHFLLLCKAGLPPKIHPRVEHDWEREAASREGERDEQGGTGKLWGGEVSIELERRKHKVSNG